jgi:hypothetical protein
MVKALTFDEWKAKGYHVIKGQKATGRNAKGKVTFTDKQVQKNYYPEPDNHDYDEDLFYHDAYGLDY